MGLEPRIERTLNSRFFPGCDLSSNFICSDGKCIPNAGGGPLSDPYRHNWRQYRCDGYKQCNDGSDEHNCQG